MSEPKPPRERTMTAREALREALLVAEAQTAQELSAALSVSERDVLAHLAHLERTLSQSAQRLEVTPARCLGCGYAFEERGRLTKPGRCPSCRGTRISRPRFRIVWD